MYVCVCTCSKALDGGCVVQGMIVGNMVGQLLDLQARREFGLMELVPRSLCVHAGQQARICHIKVCCAWGGYGLVLVLSGVGLALS